MLLENYRNFIALHVARTLMYSSHSFHRESSNRV